MLETHKYGKGSIMVWECFWEGGLGSFGDSHWQCRSRQVGGLPSQQVSSLVPGSHRKDWEGIYFLRRRRSVSY
ncbi:uncharacterized protein BYT42DRAFT_67588 [Radiomyces spectabilis]|uniref:uncharacterized protein n=1 Tax=Radiomyces spectabilis TaxID=64574 RepID=UPI0022212063|nr:uncharacterized protein BYT42DRAFT_67588 [Radiomyces spectabilis]KAI8371422.1 hypothetical protein BYT42DRAFT_67588 [Radiomyces spectabilis]